MFTEQNLYEGDLVYNINKSNIDFIEIKDVPCFIAKCEFKYELLKYGYFHDNFLINNINCDSKYVNHSHLNPNICDGEYLKKYSSKNIDNINRYSSYCIKSIKAGEHLFINYNDWTTPIFWYDLMKEHNIDESDFLI